MDNSKNRNATPGNANLQIGDLNHAKIMDDQNAIQENGAPRWHSRGYLPHFESSDVIQHVTFHLADSLPQTALLQLESQLKFLSPEKRAAERRKQVDAWIDAGQGSCILRKPAIAQIVEASLLTFDSQRYRLLAWVIMPNHVHVLFQPLNGWTVAKIVASWKKFTARKIRDDQRPGTPISRLAPSSPVWHREYWDRYIRNETHLAQAIEYIHLNPVKAGLANKPEHWRWSSAYPENPGNATSSPSRGFSGMNL